MRPQGELVPRLCAAIMASTPRSGAAVDRGASVPVSGFQQTQLMHIADSVLCDGSNKSSKGDNTWLGVAADVWRGRSIARNPWGAPPGSQEKFAVVHIAGNDFKTRGGARVKPWLDESFWDVFKEKMLLLRRETKGVFLVVWGDYELWALGFNDEHATSAAARYNGMCAEMLQRATQLDIPNRWLRSKDLAHLEHPPNDAWHFARSSASKLRELLDRMLDPRFFGHPAAYGAHRPPAPRPTPTVRRLEQCPQLLEGFVSAQHEEPPLPPPPQGSALTEESHAHCSKPLPRPSSKPAAEWVHRNTALLHRMPRTTSFPGSDELLAPLLVRSETRMPEQNAPERFFKRSRIDAEVQTEALPTVVDASAQTVPVPPEHAMAMPGFSCADFAMTWYSSAMAWYDTEECQYDLIRYLFDRGSAIPARPLFDREHGRPVLRLALKKSRRYEEGDPYWQFPKHARGAELNSRREPRCRAPLPFHAF